MNATGIVPERHALGVRETDRSVNHALHTCMKGRCNPFRVDVGMAPNHPRVARGLATLGWMLQSLRGWAVKASHSDGIGRATNGNPFVSGRSAYCNRLGIGKHLAVATAFDKPAFPIPTGLNLSAQGCRESGYPGYLWAPSQGNPERVASIAPKITA